MSEGNDSRPLAEVRLIPEKEARRVMPGIIAALREQYGDSEPPTRQDEPLDELIWAALLEGSTQKDADRALRRLTTTFVDWNEVRISRPEQVAAAIAFLDRAAERAGRIVSALNSVFEARGDLSLAFLREEKRTEAHEFLAHLDNIGGEMVSRVMFFALGHPAVPLTAYILRVSARIGLVRPDSDPDEARNRLEKIVLKDLMNDFHALFNEHGRKVCLVHSPRCAECAIRRQCGTARAPAASSGKKKEKQT